MFQVITLESWSMAIARPLLEIQPWLFVIFLVFLFLTSFGLLNIIVGVVVENTLDATKDNADLHRKRMDRKLRHELQTLRRMFVEANCDDDALVDREEFATMIARKDVQKILRKMEVPIEEPEMIFSLLVGEDAEFMGFDGFIKGFFEMRGPASTFDMKAMMQAVKATHHRVMRMENE